jgi:hypothetical protein
MSSRGRFATSADFPLQDCNPYRGLHVLRERLGAVHRSRPFSVAPCQTLIVRFATFSPLYLITSSPPSLFPRCCGTESELGGGDSWRLFDYVTRHFLASLSPDALLRRTSVTVDAAGEMFNVSGREMMSPGYTVVMPWRAVQGEVR